MRRPAGAALIGAIACCGAIGGILLGSATGALLAAMMSPERWRPGAGAFRSCSACWSGSRAFCCAAMQDDARPRDAASARRCVETLRDHRPLLLRLAGLSVFNAVGFYLVFVYIVSWLQFADGIAPARALGINTVSMVLLLPLMIAMGWLSRPHRPQADDAGAPPRSGFVARLCRCSG